MECKDLFSLKIMKQNTEMSSAAIMVNAFKSEMYSTNPNTQKKNLVPVLITRR